MLGYYIEIEEMTRSRNQLSLGRLLTNVTASNLISSSYSYCSSLDGPIHLCKFIYAHLMTRGSIFSRFGMRNPRIMWSVSKSLT